MECRSDGRCEGDVAATGGHGAPGERVEQLRRVGHEVLDGEEEERLGAGDARHRAHAHRALPLRDDADRGLDPTLRAPAPLPRLITDYVLQVLVAPLITGCSASLDVKCIAADNELCAARSIVREVPGKRLASCTAQLVNISQTTMEREPMEADAASAIGAQQADNLSPGTSCDSFRFRLRGVSGWGVGHAPGGRRAGGTRGRSTRAPAAGTDAPRAHRSASRARAAAHSTQHTVHSSHGSQTHE